MSKPIKSMVIAEYNARYGDTAGACVVDISGMKVKEQEALRASLRGASAELHVVKNRLARVAFREGPLGPLADVLDGPCALVTAEDSIIEAAKALVEAAKEFSTLGLKQAMFDGDPSLLTVESLSRLKSRTELLGDVAMLISSPGRAIAGCVKSPQSKIAGCLKAIVDKAA